MKLWAFRTGYFLCRTFGRVWLGLRGFGAERIPERGGVLVVANHASFLDPPMVGSAMRRPVHFLARSTLRVPVVGAILSAVGTLWVERGGSARRGIDAVVAALSAGAAVCIFPEGTRSPDGKVRPFERGVLLILRRIAVPVVPAGVRGTHGSLPRGRLLPRPGRVEVHFGDPIPAEAILAPGGLEALRERVRELAGEEVLAPV